MAGHNPEIKKELHESNEQCRICLSLERKLTPLGHLSIMYKQFLQPYQYNNSLKNMLICWECSATLRRFIEFQHKVNTAASTLMCSYNYYKNNSLSTLVSTFITEDQHEIVHHDKVDSIQINETKLEFNEYNESNDILIDDCQSDGENNVDFVPFHRHTKKKPTLVEIQMNETTLEFNQYKEANDCQSENEINFVPLDENTKKKKKLDKTKCSNKKRSNMWSIKKAQLNKIEKFKLIPVTRKSLKNIICYTKVQINNSELSNLLEEERKSCYFQDKLFKCSFCVIGFNDNSRFIQHMELHHSKKLGKYSCDVCKRQFTKQKLIVHCRSHFYKYNCDVCKYSCYRKLNLYDHVRRQHRNLYQCTKCLVASWSRKQFFRHYKDMHETFLCDYCGIKFKMKYCMKNHIRKKHCPLECKQCNRTFTRYNALWLHRKLKHPLKKLEKAYCVECNKHFDNVYSYKWHLNNSVIHKPRKKISIPCPGCDKIFTKNIYMKEHYDYVHLKKYKYRCDECDKNFLRNADLVHHRRRVHEGIETPKNKICYVCGRGFSSNKILNNHIRTHTGERPFQCTHCTAKFAQKVAMMGHIRNIHLKQKKPTAQNEINSFF